MRFVPILVALLGCATLPAHRGGDRVASAAPEPVDAAWVSEVAIPRHMVRPAPAEEERIARAIHALESPDFGVFSAAQKEILTIGEPAVPYLGFAATRDGPDERIPISIGSILKDLPAERVGAFLGSPYAEVRIAAASVAGERGLADLAPTLVDLLEDADEPVRRAAVAALRRITHSFHGYRPDGPEKERAEAVAKWRATCA